MIFLLKMAWRFSDRLAGRGMQPKILEQGQDRSLHLAWAGQMAPQTNPMDLASLRQRILAAGRPRWATLDWEGRLLFSDDLARWQSFFQEFQGRCQVVQQEGKTLFQLKHPAGGILEGWLEDNPADADRPIACLKRSES
jgi:hypothetical protein